MIYVDIDHDGATGNLIFLYDINGLVTMIYVDIDHDDVTDNLIIPS